MYELYILKRIKSICCTRERLRLQLSNSRVYLLTPGLPCLSFNIVPTNDRSVVFSPLLTHLLNWERNNCYVPVTPVFIYIEQRITHSHSELSFASKITELVLKIVLKTVLKIVLKTVLKTVLKIVLKTVLKIALKIVLKTIFCGPRSNENSLHVPMYL
jgi:hypothetical protein